MRAARLQAYKSQSRPDRPRPAPPRPPRPPRPSRRSGRAGRGAAGSAAARRPAGVCRARAGAAGSEGSRAWRLAPGTGTRGQKRETPRDGQARCVHLALPPGPEEGRGRQSLKRRMRPLRFFHVFILRPLSFCVTNLSARRVAPRAHVSPTSA